MKITQVLYSGKGGHGSVVQSLITADDANHFEHSLIYFGIEPLDPGYADFCKKRKISYKDILKTEGSHLKSWKKYLTCLKAQHPDVVLLHSMTLVLPTIWYCLFRKTKLVAVEHQSNQAKRKSEWVWSFLALIFARKLVYLTPQYADEIRKKFGFLARNKKIAVIPNGIDTDYFAPTKNPLPSKPIIGMASRINALRDHQTLINGFELIAKTHPDAQLHIAGDGDGMEKLKGMVAASNYRDKIVLRGNLTESELLAFLQGLTIYVHSTLAETLSTAILQAMGVGLPVVVSNIPGTAYMFEDGTEGYFFETGKADNLAEKLSAILQDKVQVSQSGKKAREKCVRDYSAAAMFKKYKSLFDAINR